MCCLTVHSKCTSLHASKGQQGLEQVGGPHDQVRQARHTIAAFGHAL